MGRIYFRQYYTQFVEYCLRTATNRQRKDLPGAWYSLATDWLDNSLSEEDREFIRFVFDKKFFNSSEGLACYDPGENYEVKRRRLFRLEKKFAIAGGLIAANADKAEGCK